MFKTFGLKITSEVNIQRTDFLDVVLDLKSGKISPYRKPLDRPIYVHKQSSHPPSILKRTQTSVESRLSMLSSTKSEFDPT